MAPESALPKEMMELVADCIVPRPELPFDEHEALTDLGMDSPAFVQIVAELYSAYGIEVDPDELNLDNFGTLASLTSFVAAKLGR